MTIHDSFAPIIQAYPEIFWQILLLLSGFSCFWLCGLTPLRRFHWRLRAVKVNGTIIGVHKTRTSRLNLLNPSTLSRAIPKYIYYPIYRYTLADGQIHENSDQTPQRGAKLEIGTKVPLMVNIDPSQKVIRADSRFFDIVDVAFLMFGSWLLYKTYTGFSITPAIMGITVSLLLFTVWYIRKIAVPAR